MILIHTHFHDFIPIPVPSHSHNQTYFPFPFLPNKFIFIPIPAGNQDNVYTLCSVRSHYQYAIVLHLWLLW